MPTRKIHVTMPRTRFRAADMALTDFGCVSRSARGIRAATIAARAVSPSNPVIEHGERNGPAEGVDAHNRNQIARNHGPRVGPRCQLAEMLRERRRRNRPHHRGSLFLRLRHFNRLAERFGTVESFSSVMTTNSCLNTFVDLET